jgi:hypothetical protein
MAESVSPKDFPEVIARDIAALVETKTEVLAAEGKKSQYIKEKVHALHKKWWDKIEKDLESSDEAVARAAMIEFNKLQCRVLPTELTSPEDGGLIMRLVSYKDEQDNNPIIER